MLKVTDLALYFELDFFIKLMIWHKKITRFVAALFLLISLAACEGEGCIEADEFDNQYVKVKANPVDDGIYGTYDHTTGGQTAEWHNTNLMSNGEEIILYIAGKWVPWNGGGFSQDDALNGIKRCQFCAKKKTDPNGNCICYEGIKPSPEVVNGILGKSCTSDDENNPSKCTCTTKNGKATDFGVFHFPLTYYKKEDHSIKLPDDQGDLCMYDRGMGLYLGLFGRSGNEMPVRAYHLFTEKMVCPISLNSQGKCIDRDGNDRSKYLYRSANNRIFVKDDLANNDGSDVNPADDIYHKPNEYIKLIIQDRYYSDNYGGYDVIFLKGVTIDGDTGLIEFIVRTVEDALLGSNDENGVRKGSVLEFMYKAIVQDTYFATTLQICLSLYLAFYGTAITLGLADVTKKELLNRTIKIALIIFFVSPNSWYWYNSIIVTWFKSGMDFLVSWIANMGDATIDDTASVKIAQMAKQTPNSSSARFAYVDIIIKALLSDNATKKIWGLFFYSFFGFLYIAGIYAVIGYFIYVMLTAAAVYIVNLIKMIFVLALGPFFMIFTLFGQTKDMFSKWLSFIGARALEIVILFLMLYTMLLLIDRKFNDLLSYRTCYEFFNLGKLSLFTILKAQTHRDLVDWVHDLVVIAGLIFVLQSLLNQIPQVAGALININGESNADSSGKSEQASSSMKLVGAAMGTASGLAIDGAKAALGVGGGAAYRGARIASRALGISSAIDKVGDKIPARGIKTMLRDSIINKAIAEGKKAAALKGLKPGDKGYEESVRNFAMSNKEFGLRQWQHDNPNKQALYDMTQANIEKALDNKLVLEPLKNFIKETAKSLKSLPADQIPLGKDMEHAIKEKAEKWANEKLSGGADAIKDHLKDLKGFIDKQGELGGKSAAKKFAGNDDLKNKYMNHLKDRQIEREKKHSISKTAKFFDNLEKKNMKTEQRAFDKAIMYEEGRGNTFWDKVGFNTGVAKANHAHSIEDLYDPSRKFRRHEIDSSAKASRDYLTKGGTANDKNKIDEYYKEKTKDLENGFFKRQLNKKNIEKQKDIDKKRDLHKQALADKIRQDMTDKTRGLSRGSKEWTELQEKFKNEYEAMKKLHLEEQRNAVGDISRLKLNGGMENYRDGLIDFNGNSLFEATQRLEFMQGRGFSGTAAGSSSADDVIAELHKAEQARLNELRNAELELKNGNSQAAQDIVNNAKQSLLPADFEVKFGASISDAIGLQASKITPQGSNILLGGSETAPQIDNAMIMGCEGEKSRQNLSLRIKKMEKMIKLHELNSASPDNKAKIEKEIQELDSEISDHERKIDNIDSQIKSLKNG